MSVSSVSYLSLSLSLSLLLSPSPTPSLILAALPTLSEMYLQIKNAKDHIYVFPTEFVKTVLLCEAPSIHLFNVKP